jgi:hypothetical protein
VDEVGRVDAWRLERAEKIEVDVADGLSRGGDPREVECPGPGVVECADASVQLKEGRDREADIREVAGTEPDQQH